MTTDYAAVLAGIAQYERERAAAHDLAQAHAAIYGALAAEDVVARHDPRCPGRVWSVAAWAGELVRWEGLIRTLDEHARLVLWTAGGSEILAGIVYAEVESTILGGLVVYAHLAPAEKDAAVDEHPALADGVSQTREVDRTAWLRYARTAGRARPALVDDQPACESRVSVPDGQRRGDDL